MKHLKYKQIAILALCIIALSACNIRQISLEDENQSQQEQSHHEERRYGQPIKQVVNQTTGEVFELDSTWYLDTVWSEEYGTYILEITQR